MMTWADFLPLVLPWAPGCPDILAEERLRQTAKDFFERSQVWRAWLPITTIADQALYTPTLPTGARLVKLKECKVNDSPACVGVNPDSEDKGVPELAYTDDLVQVGLSPIPSADGTAVRVRAVLAVTDAADGIDDALYAIYGGVIAAGALKSLCSMPDKPFTNQQTAEDKGGEYERAIARHASAKAKGNTSRPYRTRGSFF